MFVQSIQGLLLMASVLVCASHWMAFVVQVSFDILNLLLFVY